MVCYFCLNSFFEQFLDTGVIRVVEEEEKGKSLLCQLLGRGGGKGEEEREEKKRSRSRGGEEKNMVVNELVYKAQVARAMLLTTTVI